MRGTFIVQVFYFFFQLLHYGKSLRIFFSNMIAIAESLFLIG